MLSHSPTELNLPKNPMLQSKIFPVGLLLFAVLLTGCIHTQKVQDNASDTVSFEELHQTLEGRRVDITLNDQRTISSTALRIRPDTTWAIDMLSGRVRPASNNDIHSISWRRPGRGAKEGALLGAVGGALIGLAAGVALTSVRDSETAKTSMGQYVGTITGFGFLVGVGSGTLIGARRGSHDRYVYPEIYRADADVSAEESVASGNRP